MSRPLIPDNACQAAQLAGIDLSLLDESLQMTPEQRALRHQVALNLMLEMQRAGRELRDRAERTAATAL
jgi:hypothetical protein